MLMDEEGGEKVSEYLDCKLFLILIYGQHCGDKYLSQDMISMLVLFKSSIQDWS